MKQLYLLFIITATFAYGSSVTLYQNADAQIEDQKEVTLTQGLNSVNIPLPSGTVTDSLFLTTTQQGNEIISFRTMSDVKSSRQILNNYIGKEIGFRLDESMNEFYKGTLLSVNPIMVLHDEELYFDIALTNIKVPQDAFSAIPHAVVQMSAINDMETTLQLNYQLSEVRWKCNYMLEHREGKFFLTGWAEVFNGTQDNIESNELKLIAGDVHKNRGRPENMLRLAKAYDAPVQQSDTELYQVYEINRVSMLYAQELNSFKLIPKHHVEVNTTLIATVDNPIYGMHKKRINPVQVMHFSASQALPTGTVEVYDADKKLMLGEDRLTNKQKGSDVAIEVGGVYDVTVQTLPLKVQQDASKRSVTVAYAITNVSDSEKTLQLKVPFMNQNGYHAELTGAEKQFFESANTYIIEVKVPKEDTKRLNVIYSFPTK